MSQNEKRLFDRHKKQEEPPLEQTQAVPAVQDEITAEPAAEATPKRNKYADKMNRKKRRLSKGARIGITAAAVALLLGGGIWAVVSRPTILYRSPRSSQKRWIPWPTVRCECCGHIRR